LSGTRDIAQGTIYFWTSPQPILLTIQKMCPNDEHFLNSLSLKWLFMPVPYAICIILWRNGTNDKQWLQGNNIGNLEKPNTQEIGISA
jgi:hypothetical protein